MKHIYRLIGDTIVELINGVERVSNTITRKKVQPSLLVFNVLWFTESGWMDRLIAYKQLDLWTAKS